MRLTNRGMPLWLFWCKTFLSSISSRQCRFNLLTLFWDGNSEQRWSSFLHKVYFRSFISVGLIFHRWIVLKVGIVLSIRTILVTFNERINNKNLGSFIGFLGFTTSNSASIPFLHSVRSFSSSSSSKIVPFIFPVPFVFPNKLLVLIFSSGLRSLWLKNKAKKLINDIITAWLAFVFFFTFSKIFHAAKFVWSWKNVAYFVQNCWFDVFSYNLEDVYSLLWHSFPHTFWR